MFYNLGDLGRHGEGVPYQQFKKFAKISATTNQVKYKLDEY